MYKKCVFGINEGGLGYKRLIIAYCAFCCGMRMFGVNVIVRLFARVLEAVDGFGCYSLNQW
ncbi:hypothetical protein DMA11_21740 [Marinilabiliaceae bacterium JC017]|nr:hypothetical protein DMA11_21740 [Marinilabiliaceae bacterium JC017]